jgi:hypothetical protein
MERELMLKLDDFAWDAIQDESAELGIAAEELIVFSVLYYLADRDSGRIARRIPAALRPTTGKQN